VFWISCIGSTNCYDAYLIIEKWRKSFTDLGHEVSLFYFPTHVFKSKSEAESRRNNKVNSLKRKNSNAI
jgi:hypothetical protein